MGVLVHAMPMFYVSLGQVVKCYVVLILLFTIVVYAKILMQIQTQACN